MRGSWSLFGGGVHCTLTDVEDRDVRVTSGAVCSWIIDNIFHISIIIVEGKLSVIILTIGISTLWCSEGFEIRAIYHTKCVPCRDPECVRSVGVQTSHCVQ